MSESPRSAITETLLAQREAFKAFLIGRVGNEADAEDLLQNGLVKALDRAGELKDEDRLVPWFYQLLRNAAIDHHRARVAAARREEAWQYERGQDETAFRQLCACFDSLLPTLPSRHAQLLRRVELEGASVGAVAQELGLTANHTSVLLHRARAALRAQLINYCRDCACLDACDCEPPPTPQESTKHLR